MEDARRPLRDGKAEAGKRPRVLITDGLQSYNGAARRQLYVRTDPTLHVRLASIRTLPNTNIHERLNGTERERTKVMRGFDNAPSAKVLLNGQRIWYNFARPHMGLGGATPAEAAGILRDLGDDPLAALIRLAARQKTPSDVAMENQPSTTAPAREQATTQASTVHRPEP